MFAVIEVGGKQYIVKQDDRLRIEKLETKEESETTVDQVLLIAGEGNTLVGAPYLEKSAVTLKVLGHGRADKVRTFKMKAKKRYKRLKGHRQPYSEVQVMAIKVL